MKLLRLVFCVFFSLFIRYSLHYCRSILLLHFLRTWREENKKTKNEYNFFCSSSWIVFQWFYHWMIYPHGSRSFSETDLTNTMWLFMTRIIVIVIAFITLICCYFHANSTNCRWTVAASIFMNKCKHLVLSCVNSTLFI